MTTNLRTRIFCQLETLLLQKHLPRVDLSAVQCSWTPGDACSHLDTLTRSSCHRGPRTFSRKVFKVCEIICTIPFESIV